MVVILAGPILETSTVILTSGLLSISFNHLCQRVLRQYTLKLQCVQKMNENKEEAIKRAKNEIRQLLPDDDSRLTNTDDAVDEYFKHIMMVPRPRMRPDTFGQYKVDDMAAKFEVASAVELVRQECQKYSEKIDGEEATGKILIDLSTVGIFAGVIIAWFKW